MEDTGDIIDVGYEFEDALGVRGEAVGLGIQAGGEEVENGDDIIGGWQDVLEYVDDRLVGDATGDIAMAITDGGMASKVCKQFARCDNNLAEVAESTLVGF